MIVDQTQQLQGYHSLGVLVNPWVGLYYIRADGVTSSDTGSGTDSSTLHILEAIKTGSDTGSGADASTLVGAFERDDVGAGADTHGDRDLYTRCLPTGALDMLVALVGTIASTGVETGAGAETSRLSKDMTSSDTGEGTDSSTMVAIKTGSDTGSGVEADPSTYLAVLDSSDLGGGVEALLVFDRAGVADAGSGAESVELVGFVGRAMKMLLYSQPYYNMAVYSQPDLQMEVYTSDVREV